MRLARLVLLVAACVAAAVLFSFPSTGAAGGKVALSVAIDGAIGPASTRQLEEALDTAAKRNAAVLILQLNTPGGLVTSMREMIADILASPVPVIGYVAPAGGHAASAGTYILYATHVAAMAPAPTWARRPRSRWAGYRRCRATTRTRASRRTPPDDRRATR